ncbi:MAG: phosphopantetheine-binding protein [Acidobacteriota bacterium]
MPLSRDIDQEILALLRTYRPSVPIDSRTFLGAEGMGLDSIALVEVLLECEEHFGVTLAADMLSAGRITAGSLIARVRALLVS